MLVFCVGGTAAVLLAIVWAHALAGILRAVTPDAASMARSLTLGAVLVASAGVARRSTLVAFGVGLGSVLLMMLGLPSVFPGSLLVSLALPVAGAGAVGVGLRLAHRLPGEPGRWMRRRPLWAAAWIFLAVVSVVQVGRLSTYMTDPDFDWFATTRDAFWAKHECLPAYIYGAELVERGETNPWDPAHYPGLNPEAEPHTRITGLPVEDPFQYTPQFLLLPALAIQLTDHYPALRLGWYGLQTTLFLGVAWWLAMWVAGRNESPVGMVAGYFLPLTLVAFPTLHSLQYGQFHLATLALAVAGMLFLERGTAADSQVGRRRTLGGALLAASILAKIFPAVLLIPLAVQRRWRDLASIAAWGVGATVLSLAVFGPVVFANFFTYHLPRLGSGEAFSFGVAWPEVRELIIAANQGAYGLITKLGEMGVPGMSEATASLVGKVYLLGVSVLAAVVGVRSSRATSATRAQRAVAWISLLGLASMASAGAFADYVLVAFAWLLPFLLFDLSRTDSAGKPRRARLAIFYGGVAFFQFTLLGAAPWGTWAATEWLIPLSAVGVVSLLAGFGLALHDALRPRVVADQYGGALDQSTQDMNAARAAT